MKARCPLDSKEIKAVNPKGNQSWIFTGRTDAKAEVPVFWLPDVKSWLTRKDPDPGEDWGQEEEATEVEIVGWYHWLNGHEFEQTQGDSEGQRSLMCCSPWDRRIRHDLQTKQQDENRENENIKRHKERSQVSKKLSIDHLCLSHPLSDWSEDYWALPIPIQWLYLREDRQTAYLLISVFR